MRKAGSRIRLSGQPLRILDLLLARPGEVVTREQLRHSLWPADTFVDFEHNLNSAVKRLRAALGDSAETPRFIETLPRRGYRFLVPVVIETEPEPTAVIAVPDPIPVAAEPPASPPARRAASWFVLVAGVIALVAVVGWLAAKQTTNDLSREQISSVAVLPFQNLSEGPDQGFFADGLTEALITSLAQVEPLRVISRAAVMRYKDSPLDIPEIARKLDVDAVIQGSVLRDGDRVRISAQLIHGRRDRHLWAESYEGQMHDMLALQNRVARAIALEVNIKLSPPVDARLSRTAKVDPVVYELYLRGRHLLDRNTEPELKRALEYFQEAVQKDPSYALGYAGVAQVWEALGSWAGNSPKESYPKAKAAALKALELDDSLVEALTCLAFIHETYDKDFPAAERTYQRAIAINPNYALARQRYALHLGRTGRQDLALVQAQRARDLDPMSIGANVSLAQGLFAAGRMDEALQRMMAAIEIDPNYFDSYVHLGEIYQRMGRTAEAVAAAERGVELSNRGAHAMHALAQVFVRSGMTDRAAALADELERHPARNPYELALLHLLIGNTERGLTWLRQACSDKSPAMAFLKTAQAGPVFDAVRGDPRFREILRCADASY